jgi:hypothetical protein
MGVGINGVRVKTLAPVLGESCEVFAVIAKTQRGAGSNLGQRKIGSDPYFVAPESYFRYK